MGSQNISGHDEWEPVRGSTSIKPLYTSKPLFPISVSGPYPTSIQPELDMPREESYHLPPRLYPTQHTHSTFYVSSNQRISDDLSELQERQRVVQEEQERLYRSQTELLISLQTTCQQLGEENTKLRDAREEFEKYQKTMSSRVELQTESLLASHQYYVTELHAKNASLERQVSKLEREKDELQTKYDGLLASTQKIKDEEEVGDGRTLPAMDMKLEWITMQAVNKNLFAHNQALQRRCMKFSKRKHSK
ncbi:hypothetical protein PC9H_005151 [Pleurotus ostreatus]|uniref:Uncharacterized protein n=1 Tax=Pleurotus ostreatus TaxID=5322 RepID=A0A8H6ZZ16_PLEOS|nr:uncharacterized protein PC9H_005151 [Pleurotus ostreatus]KAF7433201.1 hypothetical protein PC9H_005151 [Pleurotus ostreatus]KAJ8698154.1 hypothetical protein PTI98_004892 [Pleurotus ostreatus]